MEKSAPNYKRIYHDIIKEKHPEKLETCRFLIEKEELSVLDILDLNEKIFGTWEKSAISTNQKLRSYDEESISQILNYQKKYNLSNRQVAMNFKLSRNTIAKWKKNIFFQKQTLPPLL